MKPYKAYRLGVPSKDIRVTCYSGRYGDEWIAWVPATDRPHGRDILTQGTVYELCAWVATLRDLERSES